MSQAIRRAGRLNAGKQHISPTCQNCQYWKGLTNVWGSCSAPMFAELVRQKIVVQLSAFGDDSQTAKAVIQTKKTFGCITFTDKDGK